MTKIDVRVCESTPEAICSQIWLDENVSDYVRGCWVIPSQASGAIFQSHPDTSPRIVVKFPPLVQSYSRSLLLE